MKKAKRRCGINTFKDYGGNPVKVQCGVKKRRKNYSAETVLIAVPLSEDKLFCFPSLLQCLKDLLSATNARCTVAFALNSEDEGMAAAVKGCEIPYIIIPAERPDELPSGLMEHCAAEAADPGFFEALISRFLWLNNVTSARNALREHAISHNFDWMFFLDSDTVIESEGLNTLLSYGTDLASVWCRQRSEGEPAVNRIIGRGLELRPRFSAISRDEAVRVPSPIFDALPSTAAGLINKRVFKALRYHFGFVPIADSGKIGDVNCSALGRYMSEDVMFGYEAAALGFTSVICHRTKSIHFSDEFIYPKGEGNKGEDVSYDEYMGGLTGRPCHLGDT